MPRTALNKLIPKADYLLVRSFPKVAQRLDKEARGMDRAEIDAYLKLLPGAIERFQSASIATNDLHESVEFAISQLIVSFGSRNASAVESMPPDGTSNTPAELEETADGVESARGAGKAAGSVSEPGLPNGSDTSQANSGNSLPHSELAAEPGNTGESSDQQADGPNPRVRRKQRPQGRALYKRRLQELGESGNDRG